MIRLAGCATPTFLIDALAAICLLYPFFSPLLSPIFTSFPLDFLFAGSVQHGRSASFASSLAALPASLGSSAAIAPSIRNGRPAAPYGLQYSLAHWAYYGLFRALRAAFVRPTGCAASFALIGLTSRCFVPQFAIVALLRYRLQVSFAHWTSASPVSRTARGEAPSHWARASCAPRHCHPQFAMVVPHLRTALAFGGAVFRGCALRFASCARHSSPSGLRCAALPCSLGLLRPVSATGGGLRAPLSSFR